jgi:hypothetical protein
MAGVNPSGKVYAGNKMGSGGFALTEDKQLVFVSAGHVNGGETNQKNLSITSGSPSNSVDRFTPNVKPSSLQSFIEFQGQKIQPEKVAYDANADISIAKLSKQDQANIIAKLGGESNVPVLPDKPPEENSSTQKETILDPSPGGKTLPSTDIANKESVKTETGADAEKIHTNDAVVAKGTSGALVVEENSGSSGNKVAKAVVVAATQDANSLSKEGVQMKLDTVNGVKSTKAILNSLDIG